MATGMMDRGLYQAPMGIDMEEGPGMEIEIEDPESVNIGLGDVEIQLRPEKETADTFDANLAEYMDEGELSGLANDLVADYEKDVMDRRDWIKTYVDRSEEHTSELQSH